MLTICLPMRRLVLVLALFADLVAIRCEAAVPVYGYRVVATYPHSIDSYTEGFSIWMGCFMRVPG